MPLMPARRFAPAALVIAALLTAAASAHAERADRTKPLTIDADKSGTFDLARQIVTYLGNVVVTQGTLILRAEKVELRELAGGRRVATAIGVAGKPAVFRQKRDGVDETIEGSADRIEYDDRADTVRFVGTAAVRRLRGSATADEITGALITYDNLNEVFDVQGQNSTTTLPPGAATTTSTGGRVRAIFSPREDKAPAASPGASAPAGATSERR